MTAGCKVADDVIVEEPFLVFWAGKEFEAPSVFVSPELTGAIDKYTPKGRVCNSGTKRKPH